MFRSILISLARRRASTKEILSLLLEVFVWIYMLGLSIFSRWSIGHRYCGYNHEQCQVAHINAHGVHVLSPVECLFD